ncbi:hypothetical protein [Amycolatopsis sp. CA-128772]|nr:hypothetical protein [Amycolatopsis sp. CA-128772]
MQIPASDVRGTVPPPRPFTMAATAAALLAVLDVETAHVAGLSLLPAEID